jgi:hypothetical protein
MWMHACSCRPREGKERTTVSGEVRLAWARGMLGRRRAVGRPPTYTETAKPARAAASALPPGGLSSVLSGQWPIRSIGRQRAPRGGLDRLRVSHNSVADLFSRPDDVVLFLRTNKRSPCLFVRPSTCNLRACVKIAGRLCSEIYSRDIWRALSRLKSRETFMCGVR